MGRQRARNLFHGLAIVALLGVMASTWLGTKGDERVELGGGRWLIFHADRSQVVLRGGPPDYALHIFSYGAVRAPCVTYLIVWFASNGILELQRNALRELRRKRLKAGLCPTCSYDLRESRERCPECGTPIRRSVED